MRKLQALVTIALTLAIAGCGANSMMGSGKLVTETRAVSGFTAIDLNGSGKMIIEQTGAESLTITADDNLLPVLTSEVSGGHLSLGTKGFKTISPSTAVVYKLTVKNLGEITVSGSGTVDAKEIRTDDMKIAVNGSGDITIAGRTERLEVNIAGSGSLQGENLRTEAATIQIAGSGGAVIAASDKLDVNVAGSGSVDYIGDPTVSTKITGSGAVRKR